MCDPATLAVSWVQPDGARCAAARRPEREGKIGMTRHEKQDDKDKYEGNGHDPNRPIPRKDPGGKHGQDDHDKNDDEKK